ncbi:MAG: hypothetical protein AAF830_01950 [Pseudomonadota bacterium]
MPRIVAGVVNLQDDIFPKNTGLFDKLATRKNQLDSWDYDTTNSAVTGHGEEVR